MAFFAGAPAAIYVPSPTGRSLLTAPRAQALSRLRIPLTSVAKHRLVSFSRPRFPPFLQFPHKLVLGQMGSVPAHCSVRPREGAPCVSSDELKLVLRAGRGPPGLGQGLGARGALLAARRRPPGRGAHTRARATHAQTGCPPPLALPQPRVHSSVSLCRALPGRRPPLRGAAGSGPARGALLRAQGRRAGAVREASGRRRGFKKHKLALAPDQAVVVLNVVRH